MSSHLTTGIELAYSERSDLLVVALTGRTGSGCSTAAAALCSEFQAISRAIDDLEGVERRKMEIVEDFAAVHWQEFKKITVSTVIFSYLLEIDWSDIEKFLTAKKVKKNAADEIQKVHALLRGKSEFASFRSCVVEPERKTYAAAWEYYEKYLEDAAVQVKSLLGASYAPVFQSFGDNIRQSGSPISSEIRPEQIFALIRRVKILAKASFYSARDAGEKSTRIVIDAIRNPLELVYLRDQFAAFYAIAVTANDDDRKLRLMNSGVRKPDIDALDKKEYSKKPLKLYSDFVSQNLKDCIQKADIFIANNGHAADFTQSSSLNRQIIRYVSLMLRPGLVTPTGDERGMQLAFVAKLNSGCISRQVGAAVTDKSKSIKAVGWNDVPKGQVSCLLRDVGALLSSNDSTAFSDYEKSNKELKDHLGKKFENRATVKEGQGLRCPFCFKDAYNEVQQENNQVHTRSLHAEENAFLQLAKYGNSGIEGGVLYTTASPCELCSKKAFQLGISEIVFVDPYPGISSTHVLASGSQGARPIVRLFSGAVAHAYHRLYESILPIKDEYMARLSADPQAGLI